MPNLLLIVVGIVLALLITPAHAQKAGEGKLTLIVTDGPEGKPVPCRIHLKNQQNVPRKGFGMPFWHDHFAFPGQIELTQNKGNYTFFIERGPEYTHLTGHFELQGFAKDTKTIALRRAVNMAEAGWWSGDLHVHRGAKEIELLMQAEDLHVAPLVTWHNRKNEWAERKLPEEPVVTFDQNRYYDLLAGEDTRAGGTLLFFHLPQPLELPPAETKTLAHTDLLERVRAVEGAWIDAPQPNAWDLPVWLARGAVDSIGVAYDQFGRTGSARKEKDTGRPPLTTKRTGRAPDTTDYGRWAQEIYFNVLNAGFRLPPSAGSGTGEATNHLAYNRLYVWVDRDQFSYDAWWEGLRRGRVVATNGPLLQPVANGRLPGHVFTLPSNGPLEIDLAMNMTIRDPVSYIEVIRNGRVAQSVRLDDWARTGHFPPLRIDEPGWLLVRVVTDVQVTYRFALTGPWYIEPADAPPRISRAAVQFFLDWLDDRTRDFGEDAAARKFWEAQRDKANAD